MQSQSRIYCSCRSCGKEIPPVAERVPFTVIRFDTSRGRTAYFCNKACFEKENPS